MSALGEQQGRLGEQQGELGRQQGELAREASRQMKQLLDEAVRKGIAQPEL
jgi:bla regulator protein BlaR1